MPGSAAYRAALEALAAGDGSDRAWLEIGGPDATDFLQRVLSSDLRALARGGGQWSAMLDGRGHWIADLLLFRAPAGSEDRYGLDLPAARADFFHHRLGMLHFGERLTWTPPAPQPERLLLLGPDAAGALAAAGLPAPPDLGGFGWAQAGEMQLLRRPDRGAACVELIGSRSALAAARTAGLAAGATPIGAEDLETLRIEAFEPRWGLDFDDEVSLPQSGEWRRASVTKGCYAGQEVVARVNTYGESPRQLCRLRFAEATPMAGAELADDAGKVLGTVSSWALSPRSGAGVGLATLRRRAAVSGMSLRATRGGVGTTAVVEVPEKRLG